MPMIDREDLTFDEEVARIARDHVIPGATEREHVATYAIQLLAETTPEQLHEATGITLLAAAEKIETACTMARLLTVGYTLRSLMP